MHEIHFWVLCVTEMQFISHGTKGTEITHLFRSWSVVYFMA